MQTTVSGTSSVHGWRLAYLYRAVGAFDDGM